MTWRRWRTAWCGLLSWCVVGGCDRIVARSPAPELAQVAFAGAMPARFAAGVAEPRPAPRMARELASWPALNQPSSVLQDGRADAALIVGVENYVFVPPVPGAGVNATDWYTFLVDGEGIPVERVHMVRDADATREHMLKELRTAAREVGPRGKLWFVFIGHGSPAQGGDGGVLVGSDAQPTADGLYARSLPEAQLLEELAKAPAAVALVDACFSGRTGSGDVLAAGLQPLVVTTRPAGNGKVTLLSAGAPDQLAGPLPGAARPAFSYLALGALRGWGDADGDGAVTAREAVDYTRKALNILPIGRSQTPEISGANPAMILARRGDERGPRLQDIVPAEPPRAPEGEVEAVMTADAARVLITADKHIARPTEVVGVLDFHSRAESEDKGFDELRARAAALGADAVIGAEFEHGEGREPSHLSGMAVRFR